MNQLDFAGLSPAFGDDSERFAEATSEALELIRDICEHHTHKRVAKALGRSAASLSQALRPEKDQRNGHSIKLDDLPWLLANAPNDDLANHLASLREPPASEREQLTALAEAALEYLGPNVNKGLMRAARSKLRANRRKRVG